MEYSASLSKYFPRRVIAYSARYSADLPRGFGKEGGKSSTYRNESNELCITWRRARHASPFLGEQRSLVSANITNRMRFLMEARASMNE